MRILFFYGLLAAVVLLAFLRGRSDERIAALTCVVATVLTVLLGDALEVRYYQIETLVFLIDLGVFAVFLAIALRSTRFWPLWVAGLQLTSMSVHLLNMIHPDLMRFVVGVALAFWSYPILLLIGIGAWRTTTVEGWRERARLPGPA
jgi:hypothetical protein